MLRNLQSVIRKSSLAQVRFITTGADQGKRLGEGSAPASMSILCHKLGGYSIHSNA
jgi:hypothetical protein